MNTYDVEFEIRTPAPYGNSHGVLKDMRAPTARDAERQTLHHVVGRHAGNGVMVEIKPTRLAMARTNCPWCGGAIWATKDTINSCEKSPRYHERCWLEATEVVI